MPFPAGLTLVTVHGAFDVPPSGGAAGVVRFTSPAALRGPGDNAIVPPFQLAATLDADGEFEIELPATNDPDWSPTGWAYAVTATIAGHPIAGTLQLDYQTPAVELADLLQINGTATAGVTYATLAQLTAHADDTTAVHGIADTSTLVLTGDARLTDARTPTAHAASHADGGSDELALSGEQITTGTVATARLPVGTAAGTVAAGDDPRITGALPATGGTVAGALVIDGDVLRVDGAAGTFRQVQWSTADSVRWSAHANNTAESGAGAGSDWRLVRYDDAGEALDAPIGVSRATGAVTLGGPLTVAGTDFRAAAAGPKPADHSLIGWTFDPILVQSGTVLPTSGLAHVARVQALSSVLTNVHFHFSSGGSGLTGAYVAIYNDAGALIGASAVTADLSASWATGGYKTCPLSVAQGVTPYAWYRVVWWFTGTTGPTISRACNSSSAIVNAGLSSGYRYSTADAGLTTTAPNNLAAQTGGPTAWWVGLS